MRKVEEGDRVRIHFTGSFDDGSQFVTTQGETPVELTIGEGKLISGFEKSVIGMEPGQQKTVYLKPEEAAGARRPDLVSNLPRHMVPEQEADLKVGSSIQVKDDNGNDIRATVTQLSDQTVTIYANHALAGEALTFEIELVEFV